MSWASQLLQEASNLSSLGIVPVTALLFSGGATGGGAQTLLKTLTITNTSGSTVAANSHTPTIGLLFKKGEITTGTYPVLKDAAGTTLSYTYWNKVSWSDGSLKFLGVLPRMSATIAGSGTDSLKVYTGGTTQSASSRTLAEVYAASITVHGDGGLDNGTTGDWTCDLQAANIVETVSIGDGPAGRLWRFLCNFNQSGSPHGQLVTYFYLMSLQDASGNLAGFRVLARVTQPWYDVNSPAKNFRSFTSLTLQYGAGPTTLNPITVSYSAKNFTWSGSSSQLANSTAYGYDNGTAVRLTTTGTLPTGLSTGTTYWINTQSLANQFVFCNGSMVAAIGNGTTGITLTGAGSGTHTMTPVAYLCHFGTAWMATTEGKYVYVQGGGSVAAEATLRVSADKTYDRATRVLPPYDLTIGTVTSNTSYNWAPQCVGNVFIALGGTGERDDIGILPSWHARHFYTQAAVDERVMRIIGLAQGHMTICIRDSSTKGPINLKTGATYTGMPASLAATFVWKPGSGISAGFTAPSNGPQSWNQIFQGPDSSHEPQFDAYPYIVTGEPHYMDLLIECSNMALCQFNTGEKNFTANSVAYKDIGPAAKDAFRTGAWSYRDMVWPAVLAPDAAPDGTQTSEYLRAQAANQSTYMVAWNNSSQSAWWTANGWWFPQSLANGRGSWHVGYLSSAVSLHANALEDANALTISTHLSKWAPYVQTLTGNLWGIASYYEIVSSTANQQQTPFISSDIQWGPWINVGDPPTGNLSWVSSTSVFTLSFAGNGGPFTPANGDKYIFWAATKPGSNFTNMTLYYAVNTSGMTFKLSATDGGSAVTVTADGDLINSASGDICYHKFAVTVIPKNPPSTSFMFDGIDASGFGVNMRGNTNWQLATGITTTGLSACATEFATRCASTTYTADPKWALSSSF